MIENIPITCMSLNKKIKKINKRKKTRTKKKKGESQTQLLELNWWPKVEGAKTFFLFGVVLWIQVNGSFQMAYAYKFVILTYQHSQYDLCVKEVIIYFDLNVEWSYWNYEWLWKLSTQ